ncbi:MAG: 50S ribosomal protein L21 [Alphaproteobacteria bacterium 40-19]|nr:MAG: 50S ribosomal protein L21 [Alphaproteobacteria bacterium 40-19]
MYAVLKTGGKQYAVQEGGYVNVEIIPGTQQDQELSLPGVVMQKAAAGVEIKAATIVVKHQGNFKHDKVLIFKKNRRHKDRLKKGHRQQYARLKVEAIKANG